MELIIPIYTESGATAPNFYVVMTNEENPLELVVKLRDEAGSTIGTGTLSISELMGHPSP